MILPIKKRKYPIIFHPVKWMPRASTFFLWRKYMSRALLDSAHLMKYGEIPGEVELR